MEKSSFFNSVNGDRKYKAEDFREYFAAFIGNGVFPNPSTNLQVAANNNMTVTLKKGPGWINGAIYVNTDDLILNIDVADGVLNRIDRVVLRMDTVLRKIYAYVKKGQFANSAVAPVLQRDADAYELALADVMVAKGAISITQANITDLRLNKELCGIVHGTVDQVDTTAIFDQFQDWFNSQKNNYQTEMKDNFNAWFNTIKGQLSTDAAGNLQNEIMGMIKIKQNIKIYSSGWVDDTANSGFYIYDIMDADITATTIVDVNIRIEDILKVSSLKSANMSFNGKVRLYSSSIPLDLIADLRITKAVL